ncbi:MAG: hypothetical protein WDZ93_04215 [Candidatus Paceibacterota bacterium]
MKETPEQRSSAFESVQLREDITPIERQLGEFPEDEDELLWIDFEAGPEFEDDGTKHDGPNTYLISPITEQKLFSDKNINCTAVLGIGRSRETGKEVAFISHQNPEYFLKGGPEATKKFTNDLTDTLKELQQRSEQKTVEVVILGGNYEPSDISAKKSREYTESIEVLGDIVRHTLGYDPSVLTGPNLRDGGTDINVDTQTRKIWITRDDQPTGSEASYLARQVAEAERKWVAEDESSGTQ